jgi:hypothetical protein
MECRRVSLESDRSHILAVWNNALDKSIDEVKCQVHAYPTVPDRNGAILKVNLTEQCGMQLIEKGDADNNDNWHFLLPIIQKIHTIFTASAVILEPPGACSLPCEYFHSTSRTPPSLVKSITTAGLKPQLQVSSRTC